MTVATERCSVAAISALPWPQPTARATSRSARALSFFADVAPWLDTRLALDPMPVAVMSATRWAPAGSALALWMLLPLLWRISRRDVSV